MLISLIAAASLNHVIGLNGAMPWQQPADLAYFKRTTLHHHIIMGRKTFDEFGLRKPLPQRTNIVVSRQAELHLQGCHVVHSLPDALHIAQQAHETECFVIGGGEIYAQAIAIAHRIYLTYIHAELAGDTYFPDLPLQQWQLISSQAHPADHRNQYPYTFTVWERVTTGNC